jgi:hypothetical protein
MKGLSRVKAWLYKRGFIQSDNLGDSEYYKLDKFPMIIRMGDHLGRSSTISDKYINILTATDSESYILIIDKVTKVVSFKELVHVIDSLIMIDSIIPAYLKFKNEIKRDFQQRESKLQSEINNLNAKIESNNSKTKDKLKTICLDLKAITNKVAIEMNNL